MSLYPLQLMPPLEFFINFLTMPSPYHLFFMYLSIYADRIICSLPVYRYMLLNRKKHQKTLTDICSCISTQIIFVVFEVTHLLHEPSTPLLSLSHPSPLNKCSTASFPFSHILTLIERLLHHLLFALNFMHLPCFRASGSQKRCLSPLPAMSQIYCLLSLQYLTYCHDFLSTVFEAQTKSS